MGPQLPKGIKIRVWIQVYFLWFIVSVRVMIYRNNLKIFYLLF